MNDSIKTIDIEGNPIEMSRVQFESFSAAYSYSTAMMDALVNRTVDRTEISIRAGVILGIFLQQMNPARAEAIIQMSQLMEGTEGHEFISSIRETAEGMLKPMAEEDFENSRELVRQRDEDLKRTLAMNTRMREGLEHIIGEPLSNDIQVAKKQLMSALGKFQGNSPVEEELKRQLEMAGDENRRN